MLLLRRTLKLLSEFNGFGGTRMKEKYLKPQTEIQKFGFTNVLTSSWTDIRDDDNPVTWPW